MIKRLTSIYGSVAKRIFDTGFMIVGGTTERTLQERFQGLINIRDFGAKGDYVTDDTDAVEAAINYVKDKKKLLRQLL